MNEAFFYLFDISYRIESREHRFLMVWFRDWDAYWISYWISWRRHFNPAPSPLSLRRQPFRWYHRAEYESDVGSNSFYELDVSPWSGWSHFGWPNNQALKEQELELLHVRLLVEVLSIPHINRFSDGRAPPPITRRYPLMDWSSSWLIGVRLRHFWSLFHFWRERLVETSIPLSPISPINQSSELQLEKWWIGSLPVNLS